MCDTSTNKQPLLFLGHGSPMNAIEDNAHSRAWASLGERLRRTPPRGIVVVSAHWCAGATMVTAMRDPRTIHDFWGFPDELFAQSYGAPGSPDLAREVAEAVKPQWVGEDREQWGFDHGAWSVLLHLFPHADIPVVQVSVDATKPLDAHVGIGAKLAKLRDSGVLVIGSGNIVHNLRAVDWRAPGRGYDWADRFDADAKEIFSTRPGDVSRLTARVRRSHDDGARRGPGAPRRGGDRRHALTRAA
ncbi:4,5-DOPA-extradiol-dioxygenase [Corynebacterium sp. 335C]